MKIQRIWLGYISESSAIYMYGRSVSWCLCCILVAFLLDVASYLSRLTNDRLHPLAVLVLYGHLHQLLDAHVHRLPAPRREGVHVTCPFHGVVFESVTSSEIVLYLCLVLCV